MQFRTVTLSYPTPSWLLRAVWEYVDLLDYLRLLDAVDYQTNEYDLWALCIE